METLYLFLMCRIDMNKFFGKTSMTFETCLVFMLYVEYDFNNNKHILHKASIFVHAHVD